MLEEQLTKQNILSLFVFNISIPATSSFTKKSFPTKSEIDTEMPSPCMYFTACFDAKSWIFVPCHKICNLHRLFNQQPDPVP